jgi:hypothetical protein
MAANTRYEPVGQRDSFEQAGYNQPPPSYQAEPVPGEARSEDDNVADDFKVRIRNKTTPTCHDSSANIVAVRWLCRRGNTPDPHAVHPKGLRHPHYANPPHHCPQLHQLLLGLVQELDSKQPVDDVGQHLRRNRLYAAHILEAQELCKYTDISRVLAGN